jgi:uncharacterized RDD family membrane protein YckC
MSTLTTIETPERSAFTYEVAGLGSRTLAYLLDVAIRGAVLMVLLIVATLWEFMPLPSYALAIIAMLIWFAALWLYTTLFEAFWRGQTPGKRLAGIRVIKDGGASAGFQEIALRNLLRTVDSLPLFYLVGIVCVFLTSKHQRVGDLLAGTLVVRTHERARTAELSRLVVAHAVDTPGGSAHERLGLSPAQVETIASYIERSGQFLPAARAELARQMAEPVRQFLQSRPAMASRIGAQNLDDDQLLRVMLELYHNPALLNGGGGGATAAGGETR